MARDYSSWYYKTRRNQIPILEEIGRDAWDRKMWSTRNPSVLRKNIEDEEEQRYAEKMTRFMQPKELKKPNMAFSRAIDFNSDIHDKEHEAAIPFEYSKYRESGIYPGIKKKE